MRKMGLEQWQTLCHCSVLKMSLVLDVIFCTRLQGSSASCMFLVTEYANMLVATASKKCLGSS